MLGQGDVLGVLRQLIAQFLRVGVLPGATNLLAKIIQLRRTVISVLCCAAARFFCRGAASITPAPGLLQCIFRLRHRFRVITSGQPFFELIDGHGGNRPQLPAFVVVLQVCLLGGILRLVPQHDFVLVKATLLVCLVNDEHLRGIWILPNVHINMLAIGALGALQVPIVRSHDGVPCGTIWPLSRSGGTLWIFDSDVQAGNLDVTVLVISSLNLRLCRLWQIILRAGGRCMGSCIYIAFRRLLIGRIIGCG